MNTELELDGLIKTYQKRLNLLDDTLDIVRVTDHDVGHIQQALLNIVDGSMTDERAVSILQEINRRLDMLTERFNQ